MPNRVIREGLLDSAKFNKLSDAEQMFFVRLMLIVDDYGRYDARPELLNSRCYPVGQKRQTDVSKMLSKMNTVGLIVLYSVKNKDYLEIIEYNQRLRQKKEKYPSPENGDVSKVLADVSKVRLESNPIQSEKKPNPKPNPDSFDYVFDKFREMRKKIKKPLTEHAELLIIKELGTLAPNDEKKQIAILNKSIANSWQGVFELKEKVSNAPAVGKYKVDF